MFSITKNSTITLHTASGLHDLDLQVAFAWKEDNSFDSSGLFDWVTKYAKRAFQEYHSVTRSRSLLQNARLIFEFIDLWSSEVVEVSLVDENLTYFTYKRDEESQRVEDFAPVPLREDTFFPVGLYVWEQLDALFGPHPLDAQIVAYEQSPLEPFLREVTLQEQVSKFAGELLNFSSVAPFDLESLKENPLVAEPELEYEWSENASLKRILDPHFTVANPTHPDAVRRYESYRQGLLDGSIMLGTPQAEPLWTPEQLLKENVVGIYRSLDATNEPPFFEVVDAKPVYEHYDNATLAYIKDPSSALEPLQKLYERRVRQIRDGTLTVGDPRATEWFTTQQLKKRGIVGLYQVVGGVLSE